MHRALGIGHRNVIIIMMKNTILAAPTALLGYTGR